MSKPFHPKKNVKTKLPGNHMRKLITKCKNVMLGVMQILLHTIYKLMHHQSQKNNKNKIFIY